MFERRLKIFLTLLIAVTGVLLLRSIQLQVFGRNFWVQQAVEINKRPQLIETTRGRIFDVQGREIALDEACIDACVDYRAIAKDPEWLADTAQRRLRARDKEQYRRASKEDRAQMIADESARLSDEIDETWPVIAVATQVDVKDVDATWQAIRQRVEAHRRDVQYRKFKAEAERRAAEPKRWYSKWLSSEMPDLDTFAADIGDEIAYPIVRNISDTANTQLGRQLERFPWLVLRPSSRRRYPFGNAGCHLLGLLSPVGEKEIDDAKAKPDDLRRYLAIDVMGRGGIEGMCESILRGTRGKQEKMVGEEQARVPFPAIPGRDVQASVDIQLQAQLQSLLQNATVRSNKDSNVPVQVSGGMHGAAVVIDVASGEVRALASYPDYDPNTITEKFTEMARNPLNSLNAPLMNRATQAQLEPGSTIKPVVGLGAISQGVITTTQGIECTGFLVLNGKKISEGGKCWVATKYLKARGPAGVAHHLIPYPHQGNYGNPDGFLCFTDALERSCNVYFETMAARLKRDGLAYWFDQFGLGRKTGIGIPEATGRIPNASDEAGPPSLVWFSGIGQAGVTATPIQMANVAATIARDGIWMRPRLVRNPDAPVPISKATSQPIPDRVDLHLSSEAIAAAKEGMWRVVNSRAGTGTSLKMDEVEIAGKTGTATATPIRVQAPRDALGRVRVDAEGKPVMEELLRATADHPTNTPWYRGWGDDGSQLNHAWYIGFAPAKNPQIAFAVMLEYGGSGGGEAAPIAKGIIKACIEHGYLQPSAR